MWRECTLWVSLTFWNGEWLLSLSSITIGQLAQRLLTGSEIPLLNWSLSLMKIYRSWTLQAWVRCLPTLWSWLSRYWAFWYTLPSFSTTWIMIIYIVIQSLHGGVSCHPWPLGSLFTGGAYWQSEVNDAWNSTWINAETSWPEAMLRKKVMLDAFTLSCVLL